LRNALARLALVGFVALPLALGAQGIPDALKDKALVVRVTAIVPELPADPSLGAAPGAAQGAAPSSLGGSGDRLQSWRADSVKYTVPGTPVPFKLVGSNVAIIVQITPFEQVDGKGVTLIAQGQVWVRPPEGGLSYHTTVDTLSVEYGETVLFFPLGLGPAGKASMRLEISVLRAADLNPSGTGDKTGK
jgi:hypothetical protein